eukprot:SAG25_NODE_303_length_10153_cov_13.304356_7_plen_101_part_00
MAIIPEEQRPKGASVFMPEDRELHAAWKALSRDERRLAEKMETACKLAEMADGSLICYCDGGADGNGANGVCGAVGWGTKHRQRSHRLHKVIRLGGSLFC